jgi:hypothetical protein
MREFFVLLGVTVMPEASPDLSLSRYKLWFYFAAIYNLIWGSINILFPNLLFDAIGMSRPNHIALWQVVGMFVLVYAPAYWWAARYPFRFRHIILIGLLGKILGPIGFFWSVTKGALPISFGWVILTNDLIWWPAFALYLRGVIKLSGAITSLLLGD